MTGFRYTYPEQYIEDPESCPDCREHGHDYRCDECGVQRSDVPDWWDRHHPVQHPITCTRCDTHREWIDGPYAPELRRAIDDPAVLARAAAIVRGALDRGAEQARAITCPECGAQPGIRCRGLSPKRAHMSRIEAAQ